MKISSLTRTETEIYTCEICGHRAVAKLYDEHAYEWIYLCVKHLNEYPIRLEYESEQQEQLD